MTANKILFADSNSSVKGGGQISLLELTRMLNRNEFSQHAVTGGEGELANRLRQNGVEVSTMPFPSVRAFNPVRICRTVFRLKGLIRDQGIGLIHSQDTRAHLYSGLAARLTGIPAVFHYRVSYSDGIWDKLLPSLATRTVTASNSIATRFSRGNPDRISVVYNAVDETEFFRSSTTLRKELGIPDSAFVIGSLGRLSEEKGLDTFLSVAGEMSRRGVDCHAIVVGQGPTSFRDYLQAVSRDQQISDRTHFPQSVKNMPRFYNTLNAYCLFSVNEGFNRSILEAMACECPVVASNVGGNPEAIADGETGFLVERADVSLAAEKLTLLSRDTTLRERLAAAARERVVRSFTLTRQARIIQGLYKELLHLQG